ncbi:MAG: hypothetical protein IJ958_06060 [Agathobacter sp.]|nr:hypothetical protein [Agathobacter sp.]
MVVTEIILIILGVVAFVASFFITEKLSLQDLEQITLMSEADLKLIAEKQVKEVKSQVEQSVEEIIDESLEITQRGLEKETNKKIMAVSEYSDTVLEEINKTHNEIMFLYTMLKDKQAEAADMVSDLQRVAKQVREMDVETNANVSTSQVEKTVEVVAASESTVSQSAVETVTESKEETEAVLNKNEQILLLHKEGKDEVEIAKTLDCGLGVVRLVLGLYHEA